VDRIAGDFTAQPISRTGVDQGFLVGCAAFAISLAVVLLAMWKLRRDAVSSLEA